MNAEIDRSHRKWFEPEGWLAQYGVLIDANPVFRGRRPAVFVPVSPYPEVMAARRSNAEYTLDRELAPVYKAISRHRRRERI